ncbi:penicillin-insensitive murein endopeptidase [Bacteriovorax sp. Seq25_V]|uniref:penicillin-insensitive murein endopeptidase n=1 Tax=Bacteriovorax sp. Seq25_V TaxID=1201288 RepID=UPI00038A3015|nr:penicillin-insensitive murein endopeptidase [Bacteriovorax sp. Seq25_V]EQC47993.1 peptidoglycan amidase MepA [Bacteriovorax sp. Seq25_V]
MYAFITLICLSMAFSSNAAEAVGFYSKGSLKDSLSIIDRNINVVKLYKSRGKQYATEEMLNLIEGLANFSRENFPSAESIQVGDLAAVNGGRATRHTSHQNGLDADIVYYRVNEKAQDVNNPEWAEYFVSGSKVTKNFHVQRNYTALKYLVENYDVRRIFVDTAIKREFCKLASNSGQLKDPGTVEFLRRLRPAKLHQTHFHVRLGCPEGSKKCESQAEPPKGAGCDSISMEWEEVSSC